MMKIDIKSIEEVLNRGGVVVMPTDTVYGLLCRADSKEAVSKMLALKNRDEDPGTTLFASADQLIEYGYKRDEIDRCTEYWPGPVSIVIKAPDDLTQISISDGTSAVRVPVPEWLREILIKTGPLATTSANMPGEPTAVTVEQARETFGDKIDLYVDGGELKNPPSTILRLTESGFEKIR